MLEWVNITGVLLAAGRKLFNRYRRSFIRHCSFNFLIVLQTTDQIFFNTVSFIFVILDNGAMSLNGDQLKIIISFLLCDVVHYNGI